MSYIQLISSPITLNRNSTQNVDISARDASKDLKITISANATASINGTCANNYSGIVFPANTYTISASKTQETFSHTLNYKCATIVATLQCNIVGNNLQLSFSCTPSGNDFINYGLPTHITISNIEGESLAPTGWTTVISTPFSISGDYYSTRQVVSGISANRQTRITVSYGYYSCYELISGTYGEIEPEWCDGGCYCYCEDGSQIADGEMCYGAIEEYYDTVESTIYGGTFTSVNGIITLSTSSSVSNATIEVEDNILVFNGYRVGGSDEEKYIYITKVEQYY